MSAADWAALRSDAAAVAFGIGCIIAAAGLYLAVWAAAACRRLAAFHRAGKARVAAYERVGKHRAVWGGSLDDEPAAVIMAVVTTVQDRRQT